MTDFVVDTDVLSYAFRNDDRIALYSKHLQGTQLVASFMTLAELQYGALRAGWGPARCQRLNDFLLQHVTVFHETPDLCKVWAELRVGVEEKGRHLPPSDGWIASTAVLLDVPLLSHNRRDYQAVDRLNLVSYA